MMRRFAIPARIILIALAAMLAMIVYSVSSKAADLYVHNTDGGLMILSDRPCPTAENLLLAFTFDSTGRYLRGCWTNASNEIAIVQWEDGDTDIYPLAVFKTLPAHMTAPLRDGEERI